LVQSPVLGLVSTTDTTSRDAKLWSEKVAIAYLRERSLPSKKRRVKYKEDGIPKEALMMRPENQTEILPQHAVLEVLQKPHTRR
jgi:hypothetical protein